MNCLCFGDGWQERLARLVGGVGVLQIGGSSEVEVGEKKFVFYDKKAKILISNSKNLDNIAKVVEKLE